MDHLYPVCGVYNNRCTLQPTNELSESGITSSSVFKFLEECYQNPISKPVLVEIFRLSGKRSCNSVNHGIGAKPAAVLALISSDQPTSSQPEEIQLDVVCGAAWLGSDDVPIFATIDREKNSKTHDRLSVSEGRPLPKRWRNSVSTEVPAGWECPVNGLGTS